MKTHLNPVYFEARDIPEAWFQAINHLVRSDDHAGEEISLTHKYLVDQGSFEKEEYRHEFDLFICHIRYPGTRPLVPTVPDGITPPSTMDYVEGYLPYLMEDHKQPNEEYTYGMYLKPQIEKVIEKYKQGPGNNQCFMTIGDMHSIDQVSPPCLRGIDTRVLDNRLHFIVYFRSWDLWAGFPSNLAAIQLLKEYMADRIGVLDGDLTGISKGLHLYKYTWEMAKKIAGR